MVKDEPESCSYAQPHQSGIVIPMELGPGSFQTGLSQTPP